MGTEDDREVVLPWVVDDPVAVVEALNRRELRLTVAHDHAVPLDPALGLDRCKVLCVVDEGEGARVGTEAQDPAAPSDEAFERRARAVVVIPGDSADQVGGDSAASAKPPLRVVADHGAGRPPEHLREHPHVRVGRRFEVIERLGPLEQGRPLRLGTVVHPRPVVAGTEVHQD